MIAADTHNRFLAAQLIAVAALMLAVASLALPGIAHAESCPNEQLRVENQSTSLPDCRAYELVSPSFKFGEPLFVKGIATDGSGVAYNSVGAFGEPGNDSEALGVSYVASRGTSGWAALAVNPSAAEFQGGSPDVNTNESAETVDYSADLSHTLFLQAPIVAKPIDSRFYIRGLDGAYTEIGPLFSSQTVAAWTPAVAEESDRPEPTYLGATDDLSRVLFDIQSEATPLRWVWPGDATVREHSLYEYSGTGNSEPELVGVENGSSVAEAARTEGKQHINEAAEQIGQCGVRLGGVKAEDQAALDSYNAISESGDTIFFTALGHQDWAGCESELHAPEVDELYARCAHPCPGHREGEWTVKISEPTTGPTGDCELCDESEPEQAIFQGASADGSKAFFLSEQKLISGPLGLQPEGDDLYEYDFSAPEHQKVTLVAPELAPSFGGPGGVLRVSENGSYVYFVSRAKLAANTDARGGTAQQGGDNLYVYGPDPAHPGESRTVFVAVLSEEDQNDWSVSDSAHTRHVEATADGRFLLFTSVADLTTDASGTSRQLYRYEVPSEVHPNGALVRVTFSEGGINDDGNAAAPPSSLFSPTYEHLGISFSEFDLARPNAVSISSDGSKAFFESPLALTKGALDNACAYESEGKCEAPALNVYEWQEGHVYLISDGQDTHSLLRGSATHLIGANPSGSDVFFTSADPLVQQDTDTQVDVYDARVNGGFPAPTRATSCSSECQGPPSPPPVFGAPPSSTFSGPGNIAPPGPELAAKPKPAKPKLLTRAQKLAKALKSCRVQRDRDRRAVCQSQARRRYGIVRSAKRSRGKKASDGRRPAR
jgi:hypothetical protein